jgi:hypothetical protein
MPTSKHPTNPEHICMCMAISWQSFPARTAVQAVQTLAEQGPTSVSSSALCHISGESGGWRRTRSSTNSMCLQRRERGKSGQLQVEVLHTFTVYTAQREGPCKAWSTRFISISAPDALAPHKQGLCNLGWTLHLYGMATRIRPKKAHRCRYFQGLSSPELLHRSSL